MVAFELIVCLLCLSGFGYLFIDALRMPYPQQFWDGPGAFPAVLSLLLVAACLYWLADTIIAQMRLSRKTGVIEITPDVPTVRPVSASGEAPQQDCRDRKSEAILKREEYKRLGIIILLTILYIMVLMPLVTFPVATALFLCVAVKLFTGKGWLVPIATSLAATAAVWAVFSFVLYLPMPR